MGWLHPTGHKANTKADIVVDPFGVGRPNLSGAIYPDAPYTSWARDGFGRNELVYRSIMYKAETFSQGVLRVYSPNAAEPLENHPLRQLIAQPNEVTDEVAFFALSLVHLDLAGNCYWLIVRSRAGLPVELWPVRPDLMRILPEPSDRLGWQYGFNLDPTSANPRTADIIPVPRRDIVHIKYPNPLDPYFGQAPMRAATRATSVDNAQTDYVDDLLRNDAVPRVVITTQQELDDGIIDRLTTRWMRKLGGRNRGRPAFLQQGMEAKVLGLNLDDLQFGDLTGMSESRITMSFGVQPILVGAKVGLDRSTFANFREAKSAYWEDTAMALQRMFGAGVRAQLLPFYSGVGRQRVQTRWDNSDVLALQEAESAKWERVTNAVARGFITINDGRREVGLDPVPNGDVFLIGAGVVPTPARGELGSGATQEEPAEDEDEDQETGEAAALREAAAYSERFLADLGRRSNGHHPTEIAAR
jgi:HK97 family phage portal protein